MKIGQGKTNTLPGKWQPAFKDGLATDLTDAVSKSAKTLRREKVKKVK